MRGSALGKVRVARRKRIIAWSSAVTLVALLLAAVPSALTARSRSEQARGLMIQGQEQLLSGEPEAAIESFRGARAGFASAHSAASSPGLRLVGLVPFFGRSADALRDLTSIGTLTANAGLAVSEGLAALPEGIASLAPVRGRIPLSDVKTLAPSVSEAARSLEEAASIAEALPRSWVLGPVAAASTATREKVMDALPLARSAAGLLENLPTFAGVDGAKRYFVAAMNPAELRGTGGFIGVWSILSIQDGRLRLEPFKDIGALKDLEPGRLAPEDSELAYIYGKALSTSWKATNLTPDAPTAAGSIEELWKVTRGQDLDGVVFLDPEALALMLDASGSVTVPRLGTTLTGDNLVPYVTNGVYFDFAESPEDRKDALGLVGTAAWNNFLSGASPEAAVDAIGAAAAGGHIVVHSTDGSVQEAFRTAGMAGEWRGPEGDFFGWMINNSAGNKVDFYVSSKLALDIALQADRSAATRASLALTNNAPRRASPNEALGPYFDLEGFQPGENRSILQTYCGSGCTLEEAKIDDEDMDVHAAEEQGLPLHISQFRTPPGGQHAITYSFETQEAWDGDAGGGTYRLTLDGQQPVKPTETSLSISVPPGMRVTGASDNLTSAATVVSWKGEVGAGQEFWVTFGKPPVQGGLSRLWEFLTSPVG